MIAVTPTIHFNGCCEQAINLYQGAFGAEIQCLLHYGDRDERDWNEPIAGKEHYVYHAEIVIGGQRVMMGDNPQPIAANTKACFLTLTFDSADDVRRAYDALSKGCTIVYPMQSTTYSSCMVSLIDRFGVRWGLMTEQTER